MLKQSELSVEGVKLSTEGDSLSINNSTELLDFIKDEITLNFPNFNVHCSNSYIQIWKKSWNNQGKRGIHFELAPQKVKGFCDIYGKEKFFITFKLHNEDNTCNIMPQIPKTKVYFKGEYSFLKQSMKQSVNNLINHIKKMIMIDEVNIDNAHKKLIEK